MLNKKRIIALIPARGSSKSIKKKNLVKVNKKTLIERMFNVLKKSKYIDKIICSSESKYIINHCKKIKLDFIKRPKKLSKDDTDIFFVAEHCLNYLKSKGKDYEILILAQPTSPFVRAVDVNKLINILSYQKKFVSCQTIHKTPHNYHYLNSRILTKDNVVKFKFERERQNKINKQEKPQSYSFGNLIACNVSNFLKTKDFFCQPCKGVEIDKFSSFDLDDKSDLEVIKKYRHD